MSSLQSTPGGVVTVHSDRIIEILLTIAEYLPLRSIKNIRSTCTKLQKITHSKKLMEKQRFVLETGREINQILQFLMDTDLQYLNLEFRRIKSFDNLTIFKNFLRFHGSKINSLTFWRCHLTQDLIKYVMLRSISLKELILRDIDTFIWSKKTRITPCDINETLTTLEVSYKTNINTAFIEFLLKFYPQTDSLTVKGTYRWNSTLDASTLIINLTANYFTTHQQPIKKLCLIIEDEHSADESLFQSFCRSVRCNEITLNWDHNLTPDVLRQFVSRCSKLEGLVVYGSGRRDGFVKMMEVVNEYGKDLKTLVWPKIYFHSLSHPDDFNSSSIRFPKLQEFEIFWMRYFDPPCLQGNSDIKFLEYCNLTKLELRTGGVFVDSILRALAASQNSLVKLSLMFECLDDYQPNLSQNISNLYFPELEFLYLHMDTFNKNSNSVHVAVLKTIIDEFNFPKLKYLYSNIGSHRLESRELKKILTGCPLLRNVKISHNSRHFISSTTDIINILEMDS